MCGKDASPPPDLDELAALAKLKRRHEEVYGPEVAPTIETMYEMNDLVMADLAGKGAGAQEDGLAELDLDGSSSSSDDDSDSDSDSESDNELALRGEEDEDEYDSAVWEDYKLTPEDLEQVKAVEKLPRKLQK